MLPDPITSLLQNQRSGVLATYGDGYPYTSLISMIISDDYKILYFPTSRLSRKYINLQHESRVSILVDDRKNREQDIQEASALTILGYAKEVLAEQREVLVRFFLNRHPALSEFLAHPKTALIQVTIEKFILVSRFQDVTEYTSESSG
jgi:heme iron utilization protein